MTSTTSFAFNLDQSKRVFDAHGAMTAADFIIYADEYLDAVGEGIAETSSECASEIAMFGDSGPGSMLRLSESIAEFNKVADRFTQLTGTIITRPRMPSYPSYCDDSYDDWNR
jgi:hypothetical protein